MSTGKDDVRPRGVVRPPGGRLEASPEATPFDCEPGYGRCFSDGDPSLEANIEEVGNVRNAARLDSPNGTPGGESPASSTEPAGLPAPLTRRRLNLFIRGNPETQGSLKVVGRLGESARIVDSNGKALAAWRNNVQAELMQAWRPNKPIAGAVRVDYVFYAQTKIRRIYPWMRDPETGLYRMATNGVKDADKLARTIGDALTLAGVVADDGLIVDVRSRKFFAAPPDTPPGVQIQLWELTPAGI